MYNWSVDESELKKDPEAYAVWKLEQMINLGPTHFLSLRVRRGGLTGFTNEAKKLGDKVLG